MATAVAASPNSVHVGDTFNLQGSGFNRREGIRVNWAGQFIAAVTADDNGAFSLNIVAPTKNSTGDGARTVMAIGHISASAATVSVTLTNPTCTLTPNTGAAGTTVVVTGTNFLPNTGTTGTNMATGEPVQVYLDGVLVASTVADNATGAISTSFRYPPLATGAHTVTLVGTRSGATITATFTGS
jgi:hypothetical protein